MKKQTAGDDSESQKKTNVRSPEVCVDYLSYKFDEMDLAASWREMTKQKKGIVNGLRLENASWRTWAKQRNNLKTVSPETLNWLKDSDVTWLYGPLHTVIDEDEEEDRYGHKTSSAHDKFGLIQATPHQQQQQQRMEKVTGHLVTPDLVKSDTRPTKKGPVDADRFPIGATEEFASKNDVEVPASPPLPTSSSSPSPPPAKPVRVAKVQMAEDVALAVAAPSSGASISSGNSGNSISNNNDKRPLKSALKKVTMSDILRRSASDFQVGDLQEHHHSAAAAQLSLSEVNRQVRAFSPAVVATHRQPRLRFNQQVEQYMVVSDNDGDDDDDLMQRRRHHTRRASAHPRHVQQPPKNDENDEFERNTSRTHQLDQPDHQHQHHHPQDNQNDHSHSPSSHPHHDRHDHHHHHHQHQHQAPPPSRDTLDDDDEDEDDDDQAITFYSHQPPRSIKRLEPTVLKSSSYSDHSLASASSSPRTTSCWDDNGADDDAASVHLPEYRFHPPRSHPQDSNDDNDEENDDVDDDDNEHAIEWEGQHSVTYHAPPSESESEAMGDTDWEMDPMEDAHQPMSTLVEPTYATVPAQPIQQKPTPAPSVAFSPPSRVAVGKSRPISEPSTIDAPAAHTSSPSTSSTSSAQTPSAATASSSSSTPSLSNQAQQHPHNSQEHHNQHQQQQQQSTFLSHISQWASSYLWKS